MHLSIRHHMTPLYIMRPCIPRHEGVTNSSGGPLARGRPARSVRRAAAGALRVRAPGLGAGGRLRNRASQRTVLYYIVYTTCDSSKHLNF